MNGYDIYSGEGDNGINASLLPGDFVIIKATQGTDYVNPYFAHWSSVIPESGKKLGIYHYAEGKDPVEEANHFCEVIGDTKALLAVDWENDPNGGVNPVFNSGADAAWIASFRDCVQKTTGILPLVYTSENYINLTGVSGKYLWVAKYGYDDMNSEGYIDIPKFEGTIDCAIRQYSSTGHLDGYDGQLDLDKTYFDKDTWNEYATITEVPEPLTPPSNKVCIDGIPSFPTIILAQQQAKNAGYTIEMDGIVTGQNAWVLNEEAIIGTFGIWQYKGGGSYIVKAIQHVLGVTEDGSFGLETWHALQARAGETASNSIGYDNLGFRHFQEELNAETFFIKV